MKVRFFHDTLGDVLHSFTSHINNVLHFYVVDKSKEPSMPLLDYKHTTLGR